MQSSTQRFVFAFRAISCDANEMWKNLSECSQQ